MSIQDEAAQLIWDAQAAGTVKPRDLAEELADAGLLAPELPPMTGVYWWRTGNARIDVTDAGAVSPRIENKNYTSERARKIALALLAAAKCAEEETDV